MGRIINPYEEPDDRFDLNEHGVDWVILLLGSIPLYGLGVGAASFLSSRIGVSSNGYNIANVAHNTGLAVTLIQSIYIGVALIYIAVGGFT